MRVASLHRHPLKGGAIETLSEMHVGRDGPVGDRRWMVIDPYGRFVTQREMPKLSTVRCRLEDGALEVTLDGVTMIARPTQHRVRAIIWGDEVDLALADHAANSALSSYLGREVRLAAMDDRSRRSVDGEWGTGEVSLADGFPILIVTAASLYALNRTIRWNGGRDVPMERFRPNIVIDGADEWADDEWAQVRVGNTILDIVKPCARCTVTQVDQRTGARASDEPLQTLRSLRMSADRRVPGVLFGWNATAAQTGTIRVGDECEVLAKRDAWPIRAAAFA